jgi:hypothetical protein
MNFSLGRLFSYGFSGYPDEDRMVSEMFRNNGTRPNNTIITQLNTRKYHGVRSNPATTAYFNWWTFFPIHMIIWVVICEYNFYARPKYRVVANRDSIAALNIAPAAEGK